MPVDKATAERWAAEDGEFAAPLELTHSEAVRLFRRAVDKGSFCIHVDDPAVAKLRAFIEAQEMPWECGDCGRECDWQEKFCGCGEGTAENE